MNNSIGFYVVNYTVRIVNGGSGDVGVCVSTVIIFVDAFLLALMLLFL